jgi:hypothetical protein
MSRLIPALIVMLLFVRCNSDVHHDDPATTPPTYLEEMKDVDEVRRMNQEYEKVAPDKMIRLLRLESDLARWLGSTKAFKIINAIEPTSKEAMIIIEALTDDGSGNNKFSYYKYADIRKAICPLPNDCAALIGHE